MLRGRRAVVAGILFLSLLAIAFTLLRSSNQSQLPPSLSAEGDLVFRTGRGLWSPFFATLSTETGFSHVGVLVRDEQQWAVIHSEADDVSLEGGVQITPLAQFINESTQFGFRRNEMPDEMKHKFVSQARQMLREHRPFDLDFRVDDAGVKVYCTEFVWLAAKNAGASDLGQVISVAGRDLILVDSIYQSKWLH